MSNFPASAMMNRAWAISAQLKKAKIWHEMRVNRHDGITLFVAVPGEFWEIDVLEDGRVDLEIFKSVGDVEDDSNLDRMIEDNSEKD